MAPKKSASSASAAKADVPTTEAPPPASAATTSSAATKAHTIQRATLNKPLVVRSTSATNSDKLGELPAGCVVYILETPREFKEGGPLRAPVAACDDAEGTLPKGWVTLSKNGDDFASLQVVEEVFDPKAEERSPAGKGRTPLAVKGVKKGGEGGKAPKESARSAAKKKGGESARAGTPPKKKKSARPGGKGGGGKGGGGGGDGDAIAEGLELDEIELFPPIEGADLQSAEKLRARAEYFGVQATKKEVHIQTMSDCMLMASLIAC